MKKILTIALSIAFIGVFGQAKISQLPTTTTITGAELIPVVQSGVTKQTTAAQLANLAVISGTNYVPYTGATSSVNLGANSFSVNWLQSKTDGSVYNLGATNNSENVYFGNLCGTLTPVTGIENAVFGLKSMPSNALGNGNSIFGTYTARSFTNGGQNCIFGSDAISTNPNGANNCVIGVQSANSFTGSYIHTMGTRSLFNIITGSMNIGYGYLAAQNFTSGSNNIFIGCQTNSLNAGNYNTIIGSTIISPSTTLNNNIILSDGQGNIKYRHDGTNLTSTGGLTVTGGSALQSTLTVGGGGTVITGNSGTVSVVTDVLFTTTHFHSLISSVGTLTFHFSQSFAGVSSASNNGAGITYLPYDCTLVGYSYSNGVFGTLGTANTATVYIRIDNTTDVVLNSNVLFSTGKQNYTSSSLNTNVNAGSYIEIKVTPNCTPTAATTVHETLTLYWKRR